MSIDSWANFLANEKLHPKSVAEKWVPVLLQLCEKLATIRGPVIRSHKDKLASRKLVCETAMELGIDLLAIYGVGKKAHKPLLGRGLLDAWLLAYAAKYGSTVGTASAHEAKRRDIKTALRKPAIVIYSRDPIVATDPFQKVWQRVGERTWASLSAAEADQTINDYIETQIPDCDNCYFEIVGLDYFNRCGIPYH